jgi:hypothetical protein
MGRPTLKLLVKVLVSLGLIAFLLSRLELAQFFITFRSAHISYLIIALIAYLVGQVLASFRWALLAWPLGFRNPTKDFVVYYFIGMFFNLFAPSTVGGDVSRAYYLAREKLSVRDGGWTGPAAYAVVSVVTDRAIGMTVLVWIGAVAVALFPGYALPSPIRYTVYSLALGLLLAGMLVPRAIRFVQRAEHSWGRKVALIVKSYRGNWQFLIHAALLSLLVHSIQAWMQLLVGWSLGVELPWSYCFILYPLVGTFSALPFSLNGIGLREGGYLFLLGYVGVSSEKGVAFGLIWLLIVALDSLIGGILFVLKRPRD